MTNWSSYSLRHVVTEDLVKGEYVSPMVTEPRHNAMWVIPESTDDRRNIINPVELIGSLVVPWTYRDLVLGHRVLLFQDNSTAFTVAITDYSDSDIVREITGLFHLSSAALNLRLWIEHA
jgi:hypothetical protein